MRRVLRQVFSVAFAGLIAGVVLGLVAHQDASRQEFIGVRYDCASDLSALVGILSSRASLADSAARGDVSSSLIAESEAQSATWWNRVAASCYQLDLLTNNEDDPVGSAFDTAQVTSASAFAAGNNVVAEEATASTGSRLVVNSGYWALAALAQVRASSPSDRWWWPFDAPSTPNLGDFVFGCAVNANGSRADPECEGN